MAPPPSVRKGTQSAPRLDSITGSGSCPPMSAAGVPGAFHLGRDARELHVVMRGFRGQVGRRRQSEDEGGGAGSGGDRADGEVRQLAHVAYLQ